MPGENVEVVRAFFEAAADGESEAYLADDAAGVLE
jgi:hypothetical protein